MERTLQTIHPDAVIHCAAYTKVDQAEEEPEQCWAVNAAGTKNIAAACRRIHAKMLYISTDYVFPGTGEQFYEPADPVGPVNTYGRSKLAGELAVQSLLDRYFIVRISWVFGKNGNNFVKTMLRLAETKTELNVVCDQIGSPTYTTDLAPLLCDMVQTEKYGVYHATNEGTCSWAEFAESIFELDFSESTTDGSKANDVPAEFFNRFFKSNDKDPNYGQFAPAEDLWKELSSPQIFLSNKDTRIKESIHVDNESNPEIVTIAKYAYTSINPGLSSGSSLAYVERMTKNDANWVFYRVSDMMLIKAEALICMMGEEESERNDSLGQAAFDLIKAVADRSAPNTSSSLVYSNYFYEIAIDGFGVRRALDVSSCSRANVGLIWCATVVVTAIRNIWWKLCKASLRRMRRLPPVS